MPSDYERIRKENIREYGEGTRHLGFLQRLYADRTHFIFELLQNAEDAAATAVHFVLEPQRLILSHDGRPFTEADVRGICGVGDSTKDADLTAIGRFGIGFKAVYAYTTTPEVHSGEEHFRIRHYVRPESAEPFGEMADGRTFFVFPFDRGDVPADTAREEITNGFWELDSSTLLFLHNIESLTFECDEGSMRIRRVRDEADPARVALELHVDGQVTATDHWWVFGRMLDREDLVGRRVELAFPRSGPEEDASFGELESSPLVAYFPTDKESRLGFLLQAPFRTTPARDNVPERDPVNIALVDEARGLLVDALKTLRDEGLLDLDVLGALPIDSDAFPDGGLLRRLFDGVRDALRAEALIPTADELYASADLLRLPRGTGIRELLSPELLGRLVGSNVAVYWPPAELSYERHRTIWDYLSGELGVSVITPEWLASHLTPEFLNSVEDAWLISLYTVLARSYSLSMSLRRTPLIRLEDGSHVAAFDAKDRPRAYLPGATPSEYPTVRRAVAADASARTFLTNLGLKEPDLVDEVLDKVLPRYKGPNISVSNERHRQDLDLIQRALKETPSSRRSTLVSRLQSTWFLRARSADGTKAGFCAPSAGYWPNDDLVHYFLPGRSRALFVDTVYADYRAMLTELGVADSVRIARRTPDAHGVVVVAALHGWHRRGLDGFDPDLHIPGLDSALSNPDTRRSAYVWNCLLQPHAGRLAGTVEHSTRADYSNASREHKSTAVLGLAASREWLPGPDGSWVCPSELSIEDLPPEFLPSEALASALGMENSDIHQFIVDNGGSAEDAAYIRRNPKVFADAIAEIRRRRELDENIGELDQLVNASSGDVEPLDFAAELANAFDRQAEGAHPDHDHPLDGHGAVGAPGLRRQRTAVDIAEARDAEPSPSDRHRMLPRKVWDAKDTAVRPFLMEQYSGHCQICDDTFVKRDGQPYFEAVSLVTYTKATWVDRPGNALCLCATCAAKLLHGELAGPDVLDQIRAWRTKVENGAEPVLHLELCGEPSTITYTEKHLLDLQVLLSDAEIDSSAVL